MAMPSWRRLADSSCSLLGPSGRPLVLAPVILVGDEGGGLDLDLGAVLDQRDDLDQRHRRKVPAEDVAPGAADRRQAGEVLALVRDVPGHEGDMLRPRAGRREHGNGVAQGLPELTDQIVRREELRLGPADLAGDEDEAAAPADSLGIALRLRPTRRVDRLQPPSGAPSRARPGSGPAGGFT